MVSKQQQQQQAFQPGSQHGAKHDHLSIAVDQTAIKRQLQSTSLDQENCVQPLTSDSCTYHVHLVHIGK